MLHSSKQKPASKCGITFSKIVKILFVIKYKAIVHNLSKPLSPS